MPTDVSRAQWWAVATGTVPLLIVLLTAFGVSWLIGVLTLLLAPVLILGVFWVGGGLYDGAPDRYHRAAAFAGFLATAYMARGIDTAGTCESGALLALGGVEIGYCWQPSLLLPITLPSLGIATGGSLTQVPGLSLGIAVVLTGLAGHMYAERLGDLETV